MYLYVSQYLPRDFSQSRAKRVGAFATIRICAP